MTSKRQRATILLAEGRDKASIMKRLHAAGFEVESSLDAIGAVTGTVARENLESLRKIDGVKAVDSEHHYQLPPDESDPQ